MKSKLFNGVFLFFIGFFIYVGYTIPNLDIINFMLLAWLVFMCAFAIYINIKFNRR